MFIQANATTQSLVERDTIDLTEYLPTRVHGESPSQRKSFKAVAVAPLYVTLLGERISIEVWETILANASERSDLIRKLFKFYARRSFEVLQEYNLYKSEEVKQAMLLAIDKLLSEYKVGIGTVDGYVQRFLPLRTIDKFRSSTKRIRNNKSNGRTVALDLGSDHDYTLNDEPSLILEEIESIEKCYRAVAILPDDLRKPFTLHVIFGLSCRQCSIVLGCSKEEVASLVYKARQRLKTLYPDTQRLDALASCANDNLPSKNESLGFLALQQLLTGDVSISATPAALNFYIDSPAFFNDFFSPKVNWAVRTFRSQLLKECKHTDWRSLSPFGQRCFQQYIARRFPTLDHVVSDRQLAKFLGIDVALLAGHPSGREIVKADVLRDEITCVLVKYNLLSPFWSSGLPLLVRHRFLSAYMRPEVVGAEIAANNQVEALAQRFRTLDEITKACDLSGVRLLLGLPWSASLKEVTQTLIARGFYKRRVPTSHHYSASRVSRYFEDDDPQSESNFERWVKENNPHLDSFKRLSMIAKRLRVPNNIESVSAELVRRALYSTDIPQNHPLTRNGLVLTNYLNPKVVTDPNKRLENLHKLLLWNYPTLDAINNKSLHLQTFCKLLAIKKSPRALARYMIEHALHNPKMPTGHAITVGNRASFHVDPAVVGPEWARANLEGFVRERNYSGKVPRSNTMIWAMNATRTRDEPLIKRSWRALAQGIAERFAMA